MISVRTRPAFNLPEELKNIVAGAPQLPVETLEVATQRLDEAVGRLRAATKEPNADAEGTAKS